MTHKDAAGLLVSGANRAALDHLESALHQLRCYINDPVASVDAALLAAPDMAMGHLLKAWLHLLGTEPAGLEVASASHQQAKALARTDRERGHLAAVGLLVEGRWHEAGKVLEDVNVEYPNDGLALQVGHQIDFFTGDSRMLHDRIARAMPAWSPSDVGYHSVLGMLAFGLEEMGYYGRAEEIGRRSVELEPRDGWGQHAVAHVMEMQGRRAEGIDWIRGNEAGWSEDSFLAVHNWWHLALFHLAQGETPEVLAMIDGPIRCGASSVILEMVDAAAMLWRLHLAGVDVGDRWHALADRWAPFADAGNYAFNDMHAMMAFMGAGRLDRAEALIEAQAAAIDGTGDNAAFTADIGHPATLAIQAFSQERYPEAVRLLRMIRNEAHRFGGSHPQRDVLDLTLIEAARRGGQARLAEALMHERASAQLR